MQFEEFIKDLDEENQKHYNQFKNIRSQQLYRIIFNAFNKNDYEFTYNDLVRFIRCDKSLKDVLYRFLAVVEEQMRSYFFSNYNLSKEPNYNIKGKKMYDFIKNNLIKEDNLDGEITTLYKNYHLNFSQLIDILENNGAKEFDYKKYKEVNKLRNNVMHHYTLLFDIDSNPMNYLLENQIQCLIDILPQNYVLGYEENQGLIESLKFPIDKTNEKTNNKFKKFLIDFDKFKY